MTTTNTTTALPLAPGRWALDANHSSVGFTIRHLGVSKVRGRFRSFTIDAAVGPTVEETSVRAEIDVASLDTGIADRDAHVLSADIVDVAQRPTLSFRSTSVSLDAIEGELTLGDVTQPITLDVDFGGTAEFPADGSIHAGFEARGELRLRDYGIGTFGMGDLVKLELDVQLVAPPT
ncbi:MAG: YceI family protein [Acidimicrobiales bacterium]|nr:YceI family protein [Acidimicrobiales bacterium]